MLHYYIAYGLMLVVALFTAGKQSKARNFCISFAVIWVVMLGFRHPSMGVDLYYQGSSGYLAIYEYIGGMSWKEVLTEQVLNYERGYIIFNKVLNYISHDSQTLVFACAAITTIIPAIVFYKNSRHHFMSAIIYLSIPCFLMNFSGLRQAMAIAITFAAFEMIKQRKLVWFILLVLLAGTFHGSAFIFLIAYPLYFFRFNRGASTATIFVPIIVYAFRRPLFDVLSKIFKDNAVVDNNGSITLFIIFWLIYVFCIIFGHEKDDLEIGTRNLFLMACICQAFGNVYNTAMRVGYYFMIYLTLLLPRLIENSQIDKENFYERGSGTLMYLIILVAFMTYGLYSIATSTWSMANPHTFFWQ